MIATLWSYDLFDRDSEPIIDAPFPNLLEGLRGLWRSVLREGMVEDGRRSFTDFSLHLDDGTRIAVPVQPSENAELLKLRARQNEPGFLDALAQRHHELHDRKEAFTFEPFFAIPPPVLVFELARVLSVALSSTGAPVRTAARWKFGAHVEVHCVEPVIWSIEVVGATFNGSPVTFSVRQSFAASRWDRAFVGDGPETQPLRDALLAAGFGQTRVS